jgi:hypothetical protein
VESDISDALVAAGVADPRLKLALVHELSALECVTDAQQRLVFVHIVAEYLNTEINVPGQTPRIDMAALVGKVLGVAGGKDALVYAIEMLAGPRMAKSVEEKVRGQLAPALLPVFTEDEIRRGRDLLVLDQDADPRRLHAALAHELQIDLPPGLTRAQLFERLLDANAQASDGLPPAVVLMEVAASHAPAHAEALQEWSTRWAARSAQGAAGALKERRRRIADEPPPDPDVPRCLVVMVAPADDGSPDVYVRHWVNVAAGHWEPLAGESERATPDSLAREVERAVGRAERYWGENTSKLGGRGDDPVHVEFVLPYAMLNHDVARLPLGDRVIGEVPISQRYLVHLRSLDRMRAGDPGQLRRWRERWGVFRTAAAAETPRWGGADLKLWRAGLTRERNVTAVILHGPAVPGRGLESLAAAINEGIGVAGWDRRDEDSPQSRELIRVLFGHPPGQIPAKVGQLRLDAEAEDEGPRMMGRHIAFFWDDPNRLVDCEELSA